MNEHILHVGNVNRARDQLNPIRGLTIKRAVALIEEGQRGKYNDLQWLYRAMERRFPVLKALKARRTSSICELPIRVEASKSVPEGFSEEGAEIMAQAQAETVRAGLDKIENLGSAVHFLSLATFREFAHLEKRYDDAGDVVRLEPVDQWHWTRDGINGPWLYDADSTGSLANGVEIEPANFLIREVADPVDEIGLISFVRAALGQKDWDGWIETFGIPSIFALMPPDLDPDDAAEWQSIAEKIIGDSRGALPSGSDVKVVDASKDGVGPFERYLQRIDEQLVLAGTGGLLTMLTQAGSGTLAGAAHKETFDAIAAAEGCELSELLSELAVDILARRHPGQPVLADVVIASEDVVETRAYVENVVRLAGAQYRADPDDIAEQSGINVTDHFRPGDVSAERPAAVTGRDAADATADALAGAGEPSVAPPAPDGRAPGPRDPMANRHEAGHRRELPRVLSFAREVEADLAESTLDAVARAAAADLEPVADELRRLLAVDSDADLATGLLALRANLPAMLADLNREPAAVAPMADGLAAAAINGMAEAAQEVAA